MVRNVSMIAFALVSAIGLCQSSGELLTTKVPVPQVGDNQAWKLEVKFVALGSDAIFTAELSRKVLKIDSTGDVTWESQMKDGKVLIGGSEMEQPSEPRTSVFDKSGLPKEHRSPDNELEEVLSVLIRAKLPEKGVALGTEFQPEIGFETKGKALFKVVSRESVGDRRCLKIEVNYTTESGTGNGTGLAFIDSTTGLLIRLMVEFKNISVAPGIVSDGSAQMKFIAK